MVAHLSACRQLGGTGTLLNAANTERLAGCSDGNIRPGEDVGDRDGVALSVGSV